ncbi:MAG TPA: hypothetical protein VJJ70_12725 [Anaerolineales bacterium]|nr:hypothetical protein [Anaerolineales bacterium]HLE30229.1 hypothetical protein [Anaerolineales bacterium]
MQLHLGIGNWMGCYHWVPASDLFDGLPTEGLAGSLRDTQTRHETPRAL